LYYKVKKYENMNIMQLNTLAPAEGEKRTRRRVGRGIGSGFGKTCGRGHTSFLPQAFQMPLFSLQPLYFSSNLFNSFATLTSH
jgi:hypothetical protein